MSRQSSPSRSHIKQPKSSFSPSSESANANIIMLLYGDQNNFIKYTKHIQSYAYQYYGYLGNIFTPGTNAYYYSPQPVRPTEAELEALPDDAARETALEIYREEIKLWVKERGILVKNRVPLFDAIYSSYFSSQG